ncbi:MAG: universal stress protein [Lachnoclostridium sp.]|nr:universal stress protein [Lachnoclostridium sp.]
MNDSYSRLITLAIHTLDKAEHLKNILEKEGVATTLQNVNLENPEVSSGVRVRIKEADLPLALRIIENLDIFACECSVASDSRSPLILVPVDFSEHSLMACDLAFRIASHHNASIRIIHTYIAPSTLDSAMPLSDVLTFDNNAAEDAEIDHDINTETQSLMDNFVKGLKQKIKNGQLPAVKFKADVLEGVPEEVIDAFSRENHPMLIVMGTRGAGKKERDLVGSVTAEVLDTCRYPVFTVPEKTTLDSLTSIKEVMMVCSLDQEDILALDALYRLFPTGNFNVTLVNLPSKKYSMAGNSSSKESLLNYCRRHYDGYTFAAENITKENTIGDFERIYLTTRSSLIVVPNRKKNIFARLFNPGIAHKLLFHIDVPMMVIPV